MENFKVNILGETWQVKYKTPVINPYTGDMAAGLCDPSTRTIWIEKSLESKMSIITLFHELFHAYTRRSGIYNAQLSHDLEEIVADQFATVIAENFHFEL